MTRRRLTLLVSATLGAQHLTAWDIWRLPCCGFQVGMTANRMFTNTSEESHDDTATSKYTAITLPTTAPSMLFRTYIVGTYRACRH